MVARKAAASGRKPAARRAAGSTNGRVRAITPDLAAAVNIDALLAAERERSPLPPFEWRGRTWDLAWDLAFTAIDKMDRGDITGGLVELFGPDVLELQPSVGLKEASIVLREVNRVHGIGPGESEGS